MEAEALADRGWYLPGRGDGQVPCGVAQLLEPEAAATPAARPAAGRRRANVAPSPGVDRHRLAAAWGLEGAPPSQALIDADRDGLLDRLRLGWLLSRPEALALIPAHDRAAVVALDRTGRPFAPDRLLVALAPRVAALQALAVPALLERFAAGERSPQPIRPWWPAMPPPTGPSWPRLPVSRLG